MRGFLVLLGFDDERESVTIFEGLDEGLLLNGVLAEALDVASESREVVIVKHLSNTTIVSTFLANLGHNDPINLDLEFDASGSLDGLEVGGKILLVISNVLTGSNGQGRVARACFGQIITGTIDIGAEAILGKVNDKYSSFVRGPGVIRAMRGFLVLLGLNDEREGVTIFKGFDEGLLLDGILAEALNVISESREVVIVKHLSNTTIVSTFLANLGHNDPIDFDLELDASGSLDGLEVGGKILLGFSNVLTGSNGQRRVARACFGQIITGTIDIGAEAILGKVNDKYSSFVRGPGVIRAMRGFLVLLGLNDEREGVTIFKGFDEGLLLDGILAEALNVISESREVVIVKHLSNTTIVSTFLANLGHNDPINLDLEFDTGGSLDGLEVGGKILLVISNVLAGSNGQGGVARACFGQIITGARNIGAEAILGKVNDKNSFLVGGPGIRRTVG